jgi:hypothetical protein
MLLLFAHFFFDSPNPRLAFFNLINFDEATPSAVTMTGSHTRCASRGMVAEGIRWEAVFSGDEWPIPMFRAKIPHFTSKIVEHSRHLPSARQNVATPGKLGEYSDKSDPIIEN